VNLPIPIRPIIVRQFPTKIIFNDENPKSRIIPTNGFANAADIARAVFISPTSTVDMPY